MKLSYFLFLSFVISITLWAQADISQKRAAEERLEKAHAENLKLILADVSLFLGVGFAGAAYTGGVHNYVSEELKKISLVNREVAGLLDDKVLGEELDRLDRLLNGVGKQGSLARERVLKKEIQKIQDSIKQSFVLSADHRYREALVQMVQNSNPVPLNQIQKANLIALTHDVRQKIDQVVNTKIVGRMVQANLKTLKGLTYAAGVFFGIDALGHIYAVYNDNPEPRYLGQLPKETVELGWQGMKTAFHSFVSTAPKINEKNRGLKGDFIDEGNKETSKAGH